MTILADPEPDVTNAQNIITKTDVFLDWIGGSLAASCGHHIPHRCSYLGTPPTQKLQFRTG